MNVRVVFVGTALATLPGCFSVESAPGGSAGGPAGTGGVTVSPNALDLGTVTCGSRAPDQVVTVQNTLNVGVSFTASIGKGSTSPFQIAPPNGQIPPGGSVQIAVMPATIPATAPVTASLYADTLTVTTDAPGDTPHTMDVHQTVSGASLSSSTTTVAFGKQPVAQASAATTVTIKNDGSAPATLKLVATSAAYAFDPSSFTVSPGGSQPVHVTFTPGAVGDQPATLGLTTTDPSCALTPSIALTGTGQILATKVAVGAGHTCALIQGGRVACWGENGDGQLGVGNAGTSQAKPAMVGELSDVTAIGAGKRHTCALTSGGQVYCWGFGGDGSIGNGVLANVATPTLVPGLNNVSALGVGWHGVCAGVRGGAVSCWGGAFSGSFSNGNRAAIATPAAVAGVTSADEIITGASNACARAGGTVTCWDSKAPVAAGVTGATALAAGNFHQCALTGGGATCWGSNSYGQLGNGQTANPPAPVAVLLLTNATAVAGGYGTTCATQTGQVYCWGQTSFLGTSAWPPKTNLTTTPVPVASISGAVAVAVSRFYACAALSSGGVACWGRNGSGQLGDGTTNDSASPVNVLYAGP